MPAAEYLHGVETIELTTGAKPVQGAKTAVIGLVGTAPVHHVTDGTVNALLVSLSDVADAKQFGPNLSGYTIPQALEIARAEGAKWAVVVNVFDPATHKTTVAAADLNIEDGEIQLAHTDIITVVVKAAGGAGAALVAGVDYTIDRVTGLITILPEGDLEGEAAANVTYDRGNPGAVDDADIIGGVDDGVRTGMQLWRESFSTFGFYPKILIAPGYSTSTAVVSALRSVADKCRAVALIDAPAATTVEEAIEGRGPAGAINFNVSDRRVVPLFPHVKVYDRRSNTNVLAPYSAAFAGVIAKTDLDLGFWWSPSNKPIRSIVGLELPVVADLRDEAAETNQLNAVGIVTVFNAFGTGYRTWGNRTSAFPSDTTILAHIVGRRISDQVHESLELAMLDFIDQPITPALIQAVLDTTNAYIRTLIRRGALPAGSRVEFLEGPNPPEEVAAGHLTFSLTGHPTPPAERIAFESYMLDMSLLKFAA